MNKYNPQKIEKHWQKYWQDNSVFKVDEKSDKPKFYCLDMFPYPSGEGLHVGHPKGYIATDVIARYKMLNGFNVLHPMGFDSFGLPAENYAIKNKVHPSVAVDKNIARYKDQLEMFGFTYDWDREVITSNPDYYKWTQWMFLQMFKKGLAYESNEPINWCSKCKTGLANEDVEDGKCERCGTPVDKKPMRQWVLKMTDYAERLLNDLKLVDWEDSIIEMQKNWIGRSSGSLIKFQVTSNNNQINSKSQKINIKQYIEVYTTRPDTLFGATFMVICPEHELITNNQDTITNYDEIKKYLDKTKNKSELERTDLAKDKTGIEIKGIKAINPANNEEIPIFVADYVLPNYGTGAIMAVPAHDERDNEFAKKYHLPIKRVIEPKFVGETGEAAVKKELPFIKRDAICAIVKNPKNDAYLCISWKTVHMHGLITGGIEKDEDMIKTALREIHEETGYKNIRFIKDPNIIINTFFYHRVKKENRWARFHYLFFELENEEIDQVDDKEASLHEVVWKKKSELKDFFSVFEGDFIVDLLDNDELVFAEKGILGNSGKFDGMESDIAKDEIAKFVGGKKTVQYKLKDWVFSRQRYWGEPIPLIHCENCKIDKAKVYIIPGTGSNSKSNWYPWLAEKLQSSGHDVKVIDMPDSDHPDLGKWLGKLNKYKLEMDDSSIIIGHSLGAMVAMHFVASLKTKINKVILVAPTHPNENWDEVAKKHPNNPIDHLKKFCKNEINFDLFKKHTNSISMYYSDNDTYIPIKHFKDYINLLNPECHFLANRNHFSIKNGNADTLPEILVELENQFAGIIPVPEDQLPLKLPDIKNYEPTGTGESPLANIKDWVNTTCPKCGGTAKRETNTMPQWAGSSWYYLAYTLGTKNLKLKTKNENIDKNLINYWMEPKGVDLYVGGAEHATRHLIYARFWHKFLYDIGVVTTKEPFYHLQHVGLINGEDGRKMSKRWGNVINPDDVIKEYGADALRCYEMFMGPFDESIAWSTQGVKGTYRFLEKVCMLGEKIQDTRYKNQTPRSYSGQANLKSQISNFKTNNILVNQTIKKVTEDIENFKFNTAISALMILVNEMTKNPQQFDNLAFEILILLLSPFAPHLAEELWAKLGNKELIIKAKWPEYDESKIKSDKISVPIQVNGNVRAVIEVESDIAEDKLIKIALANQNVSKYTDGKKIKKTIYISGKILSFVI